MGVECAELSAELLRHSLRLNQHEALGCIYVTASG